VCFELLDDADLSLCNVCSLCEYTDHRPGINSHRRRPGFPCSEIDQARERRRKIKGGMDARVGRGILIHARSVQGTFLTEVAAPEDIADGAGVDVQQEDCMYLYLPTPRREVV